MVVSTFKNLRSFYFCVRDLYSVQVQLSIRDLWRSRLVEPSKIFFFLSIGGRESFPLQKWRSRIQSFFLLAKVQSCEVTVCPLVSLLTLCSASTASQLVMMRTRRTSTTNWGTSSPTPSITSEPSSPASTSTTKWRRGEGSPDGGVKIIQTTYIFSCGVFMISKFSPALLQANMKKRPILSWIFLDLGYLNEAKKDHFTGFFK